MKKTALKMTTLTLVLILISGLPVMPALAANATYVTVGGVTLNAATPYWANGAAAASAAAPATGGYVYFNETANTLTLNNAVMDTAYTVPGNPTLNGGLSANGDVKIVLIGASTIAIAANSTDIIVGIMTGATTVSGGGSLNIQLSNTNISSHMYGMLTFGDLTILSGTITVSIHSGDTAYGIMSNSKILIAGGNLDVQTKGSMSMGFYSFNDFIRFTGGTVSAKAVSKGAIALGIYADAVYMEGGTGSFSGTGGDISGGLGFKGNALSYAGGVFYYSGLTSGLLYDNVSAHYTVTAPAGSIFVSKNFDGSDLRPWTSEAADGQLITLFPFDFSEFLYVRFSLPDAQTGDASTPWLWAGIALVCLLSVAGITAAARRKRA